MVILRNYEGAARNCAGARTKSHSLIVGIAYGLAQLIRKLG